jgi:hypothetical protein
MSDFQKMLDRFEDHEANLRQLGDLLVERYPQSHNLIQLAQELGTAIDGLAALKTRLGEAIHEAESQAALSADIAAQMAANALYQSLSERDRQKLVEYLLQNAAGLATQEELEAYVLRSLEQKSDAELLAEFSKAHILELGQAILPDATEFDAYKAGMDAIRQQLADPTKKADILADLAKVLLSESPATVVKLFYSAAFKQPDQAPVDVNPAPIIEPGAKEQPAPNTPEPSTQAPEPEAAPV